MKQSKEKAAEAKQMNAQYDYFAVYCYDAPADRKFYHTFGRAYKAANARAAKGDNVALFGYQIGSFNDHDVLYCC